MELKSELLFKEVFNDGRLQDISININAESLIKEMKDNIFSKSKIEEFQLKISNNEALYKLKKKSLNEKENIISFVDDNNENVDFV